MNEYDFGSSMQEQHPGYQSNSVQAENPGLFDMMSKMVKDMNFVGIFTIIAGVLYCLTIFGAVVGVPIIFAGIRLRNASMEFERYLMTNDLSAIFSGFEKQKRYFFIYKVLIIVGIIFFILYIVFIALMIGSGMFSDLNMD